MALVTTTKGEMDETLLEGELVHRSAHVQLKKTVTLTSSVASF